MTSNSTRRGRQWGAPIVRPALQEDFEAVVRLAESTQPPGSPSLRGRLARHFSVRWPGNDDFGYVLDSGQGIVGFLASLTHVRRVRGELHTVCNLASWYVSPDHRPHSLALLREALRRPDITYTAFSPRARVAKIVLRFGFQTLETHRRIIYPVIRFRRMRPRPSVIVGDVSGLLSDQQLQVFHDHRDLPCEHAVVEHGNRQCYMILVRRPRKLFSSARIDYLSDRSLFAECLGSITGQLCRQLRVTSISVHDRFLGDVPVRLSQRRPLAVPHMFRSASLGPADVDSLYSESVVMGF